MQPEQAVYRRILFLLFLWAVLLSAPTLCAAAFVAPRQVPITLEPAQLFALDLNEDGRAEVIVRGLAPDGSPVLQVLHGVATGNLASAAEIALDAHAKMVSGHLNADQRLDLLQIHPVPHNATTRLTAYLQDGDFSFDQQIHTLPFSADWACVGDFDGQNGPDLALGELGGFGDPHVLMVRIFLDDGQGSYQQKGVYPTAFADLVPAALDPPLEGRPNKLFLDAHCVDLNADGRADLAVSQWVIKERKKIRQVTLLLNSGDGKMGQPINLLAQFSGPLQSGDVDGDGDSDLFAIGKIPLSETQFSELDYLYCFVNDGKGHFTLSGTRQTGHPDGEIRSLTSGDVDGDGRCDVLAMAVNGYGPDDRDAPAYQWLLFRGQADGTLTLAERYVAGGVIMGQAIADMDGEGGPELVTVSASDERVAIFPNINGQFPYIGFSLDDPDHPEIGNAPTAAVAADTDRDGFLDLIVTTNAQPGSLDETDTVAVLKGAQNGISGPAVHLKLAQEAPVDLVFAQLAANDHGDLAVLYKGLPNAGKEAGLGILLGQGDGSWATERFTPIDGAVAMTTLDLDGDDTREIAILRDRSGGTAELAIRRITAQGSAEAVTEFILGSDSIFQNDLRSALALASADLDDDGDLDLLAVTSRYFGDTGVVLTVLRNDGAIGFTLSGDELVADDTYTTTHKARSVTAADLNGDKLPEILIPMGIAESSEDMDGELLVLTNEGGTFGTPISYAIGRMPVSVQTARVNDDNHPDVIVACDGNSEIQVLYNDGTGQLGGLERYFGQGGTDGALAADLNGDGHADVAVLHDEVLAKVPPYNHRGSVAILYGGDAQNLPDTVPPVIVATQPADQALEVDPADPIQITFSEALKPASVTAEACTLAQGATTVTSDVSCNGATVVVIPERGLSPQSVYTVTVTTGIQDLAGNALATAYTWSFTTAGGSDGTDGDGGETDGSVTGGGGGGGCFVLGLRH